MTKILITGAGGMIGRALMAQLANGVHEVIATDLKAPKNLPKGVRFTPLDVTTDAPARVIAAERPEVSLISWSRVLIH